MTPAARPRRRRRDRLQIQRYQGYELRKIGCETVEVIGPGGELWGWASDWKQAMAVVDWLCGAS